MLIPPTAELGLSVLDRIARTPWLKIYEEIVLVLGVGRIGFTQLSCLGSCVLHNNTATPSSTFTRFSNRLTSFNNNRGEMETTNFIYPRCPYDSDCNWWGPFSHTVRGVYRARILEAPISCPSLRLTVLVRGGRGSNPSTCATNPACTVPLC